LGFGKSQNGKRLLSILTLGLAKSQNGNGFFSILSLAALLRGIFLKRKGKEGIVAQRLLSALTTPGFK
jgi:hypothetical protein